MHDLTTHICGQKQIHMVGMQFSTSILCKCVVVFFTISNLCLSLRVILRLTCTVSVEESDLCKHNCICTCGMIQHLPNLGMQWKYSLIIMYKLYLKVCHLHLNKEFWVKTYCPMAQISSHINITLCLIQQQNSFLFHGPVWWTCVKTVVRYSSVWVKCLLLASVNVVHITIIIIIIIIIIVFFGRSCYLSTGFFHLKFDITSNFLTVVTMFILVGL
jgi:hypothetical protein